jgi:aerobic carbon-monoxide dehydrogenase medium subunit
MTVTEFTGATSVAEAVSALCNQGGARVVAGATWLMRAPLRGEDLPKSVVSISGIAELCEIEIGATHLSIGACVTHARLAAALATVDEFRGLADAAGQSANPAIRSVATVGGNLSTADFAAADLVPALLSLEAELDYHTADGAKRMGLETFLATRTALGPGLITRIQVPRGSFRTAHARIPLRKAGDYPVAIVSVKASQGPDSAFHTVRIAVGSVESIARRWTALEAAVEGRTLSAPEIAGIAGGLTGEFSGRDGIEAPGWYRVQVLPALVRRAFEHFDRQRGNE